MSHDPVLLHLCSEPAELLVRCAPEMHRQCVTIEKDRTVSCVDAMKVTCGTLVAAVLSHERLHNDLENEGFVINPHNPCVANEIADGKQFKAVWHDDLKCSHKDSPAVDKFIKWLREMHEDNVGEVKVSRGKRHDFLCVDLDFSSEGDFKIDVVKMCHENDRGTS